MGTLADAGVLAGHLGLDLSPRKTPKLILDVPTVAPCRCKAASDVHDPQVWASEPERCHKCGRWLDEFIGTEYEDYDFGGVAELAAAVARTRDKVRQEFEDSGASDYESWLEARLAAADRELDRMCGRLRRS